MAKPESFLGPIELAVRDPYGSFTIEPVTLVVVPDQEIRWKSADPFIIRFIESSPFPGMSKRSQPDTEDGYVVDGRIRATAETRRYEYAVAISQMGKENGLQIHTSGEIIVDPGNW